MLSYTKPGSGIGRKIIPAPLVAINKVYQSNPDGSRKGTLYNITLTGTLLPFNGSPSGIYTTNPGNSFWTQTGYPPDVTYEENNEDFNHILRKQEALRWLFNEDGGSLEWQPASGQPVVKCNPRLKSINFANGVWADRCDFTIEFEADWIYLHGTSVDDNLSLDLIESSQESWTFQEVTGRVGDQCAVTHNVSAKGKRGFDENGELYDDMEAWEHAKMYVDALATGLINDLVRTGGTDGSLEKYGNYVKTVAIDEDAGGYSVTEEWLLSVEVTYTEEQFSANYSSSNDFYEVTYNGTIYGVGSNVYARAGAELTMNAAKNSIPSEDHARTRALLKLGSIIFPQ